MQNIHTRQIYLVWMHHLTHEDAHKYSIKHAFFNNVSSWLIYIVINCLFKSQIITFIKIYLSMTHLKVPLSVRLIWFIPGLWHGARRPCWPSVPNFCPTPLLSMGKWLEHGEEHGLRWTDGLMLNIYGPSVCMPVHHSIYYKLKKKCFSL